MPSYMDFSVDGEMFMPRVSYRVLDRSLAQYVGVVFLEARCPMEANSSRVLP